MSRNIVKPRADSKLKTLPLARQAEIAEMLRTRRLEDVADELGRKGFIISTNALSEFYSWWQLQQARLGASVIELQHQIVALQRRMDHRNYQTEQLADKARAARSLLKSGASQENTFRALRELFGIKTNQ